MPQGPELQEKGDQGAPAPGASPANPDGKVFISYASQDAAVANNLCEALERAGLPCWLAPRNVRPGDFYADAIVQAINACPALVLVLSQSSVGSEHVLREVERASAKRRPVVAFRIDITPLPPGLEYFLSASQWIDVSGGPSERGYPKLVESLRGRVGSTPKADFEPTLAVRRPGRKRLSRPVMVLLLLVAAALGYFVVDRVWLAKHVTAQQATPAATSAISDRSIAVLPFTDLSEKHDQEYFADGMAEEILNLLVKIPELRVIARTSSFQFKGKSDDLRKIGETLGAAYVVEGSVRRSGDHFRVTAQLIDTRNGTHHWSETYDRDIGDVLKVQGEVATSLVRSLQLEVTNPLALSSRPTPRSNEAYDIYLRGLHAREQFNQRGEEEAVADFRRALELDPSFVEAAESLAVTLANIAFSRYVPPETGWEQARLAAERVLSLSPKSALGHALLGIVHVRYDWDWPAADREFNDALELSPNLPFVLNYAAKNRMALGDWSGAAQLVSAASTLDPLDPGFEYGRGLLYLRMGRIADAERAFRHMLDISPTFEPGHFFLGTTLLLDGRADAALAEMRKETRPDWQLAGLALAYHALRKPGEADAALARLEGEFANNLTMQIAEVHAFCDQKSQAFMWLDRAFAQKDVNLWSIKGDPLLKNLESDPRYKAFLRKMNLPE